MGQVVIENPVINSPFEEPARHFLFTSEGISNQVQRGRRGSSYFVPIAQSRSRDGQETINDWTADRIEPNPVVDRIRLSVARMPAVNGAGEYGRWAFSEVSDPWDVQNTIRSSIDLARAARTN